MVGSYNVPLHCLDRFKHSSLIRPNPMIALSGIPGLLPCLLTSAPSTMDHHYAPTPAQTTEISVLESYGDFDIFIPWATSERAQSRWTICCLR